MMALMAMAITARIARLLKTPVVSKLPLDRERRQH
jgi:hypothetical protein